MIIGTFHANSKGEFTGEIITIGFCFQVRIEPQEKGADFKIMTGGQTGYEIGAAWKKTSEKGKDYLSVRLDGPLLEKPVNAALLAQEDGLHILVWSREDKKKAA